MPSQWDRRWYFLAFNYFINIHFCSRGNRVGFYCHPPRSLQMCWTLNSSNPFHLVPHQASSFILFSSSFSQQGSNPPLHPSHISQQGSNSPLHPSHISQQGSNPPFHPSHISHLPYHSSSPPPQNHIPQLIDILPRFFAYMHMNIFLWLVGGGGGGGGGVTMCWCALFDTPSLERELLHMWGTYLCPRFFPRETPSYSFFFSSFFFFRGSAFSVPVLYWYQ